MVQINRILSVSRHFVLMLLFAPAISQALSLGSLSVNSQLGEALDIEIELQSVTPADLGSLTIELASRSDFDRAEVDYPAIGALLRFDIRQGGNSGYFISLTSQNPVNETFLHLLLVASWSGGKVVREYTALLDPPLYSGVSGAVVNVPATIADSGPDSVEPVAVDSTTMDSVVGETASAAGIDSESTMAVTPVGDSIVTVVKGDTLSGIVRRLNRPSSVSMFQGLSAIQAQNPDAFIDGNMNRLRAGVELQIPSFDEMGAINRSTAVDNFSNQLVAYNQYVASISATPVTLPSVEEIAEQLSEPVPEPVTETETTAELDQAEVDQVEPVAEQVAEMEPAESTEDQVVDQSRLSIGQEPGSEDLAAAASGQLGDTAQVDALKTQLAQLDETMLVTGEENTELRQQLEDMQAQVDRLSRLLEVEDTGLTLAQNQAADSQSAAIDPDPAGQSDLNQEELQQEELQQGEQLAATDEADLAETEDETAPLDTAGLATIQPVAAPSSSSVTAQDVAEDVAETEQMEGTGMTAADRGQAEEAGMAGAGAAEEDTTEEVLQAVESDTIVSGTEAGQGLSEGVNEDAAAEGSNRQVVDTSIMDAITGMFSSLGSTLGSFSDYALKIAAALIALLTGLFFYRRHRSQREFEESMLDIESEQISSNSELASLQRLSAASGIDLVSQNSGLDLTVGGGMSFLSEDGVSGVTEEENEVIQAGVVDPLAEADVYLAYDRDEQAIQVLKEAYTNHPERMELAEKLLEIYHKQDDRRAFDALATELHRRMGSGTSSEWVNIAAMGREVSPGNVLYTTDSDDVDISTEDDGMIQFGGDSENAGIDVGPAFGAGGEEELDLVDIQSQDTAIKNLVAEDIDIDAEGPEEEVAALDTPTLSQIIQGPIGDKMVADKVDEDRDQIGPEVEEQDIEIDTEEIETGPIETMKLDSLQIDSLDEDSKPKVDPAVSEDPVQEEHPVPEGDESPQPDAQMLDEDSFLSEMSEQSMSQLEPYHESETALELAKAYIELGEKDIAKGFIEEVINEGSDKQKQKAEKLVKDLTD